MRSPRRKANARKLREETRSPGDQIAILSSLVTRKATFLLALIWIGSPVAGLRPMRAARFRTCRLPSPAIFTRSRFFKCLVIKPARSLRISWLCFLVNLCFFAKAWANCFVLIAFRVVGLAAAGFAVAVGVAVAMSVMVACSLCVAFSPGH